MKIAAYTIVKNEFTFLPIWYDYYKDQFGEENVFIYDNDTVGEIDEYNVYKNVIKLHSEFAFDHGWLRSQAFRIMTELLKEYDYVVCTDADEILIPHPESYKNIHDYVEKHTPNELIYYSVGYEILSKKDDAPIDFTMPLLKQRTNWVKLKNFYKPVISAVPVKKMYSEYKNQKNSKGDLYLIHLNRIDYHTAYCRYKQEKNYTWCPQDMGRTDGWQHRLPNDAAFDRYYTALKNATGKIEEIGEWIRSKI